jgi:hypothetical protein
VRQSGSNIGNVDVIAMIRMERSFGVTCTPGISRFASEFLCPCECICCIFSKHPTPERMCSSVGTPVYVGLRSMIRACGFAEPERQHGLTHWKNTCVCQPPCFVPCKFFFNHGALSLRHEEMQQRLRRRRRPRAKLICAGARYIFSAMSSLDGQFRRSLDILQGSRSRKHLSPIVPVGFPPKRSMRKYICHFGPEILNT